MSVVVNRPVIHPEDWPHKRLLCVITFGTCYLFSSLTPPRTSNLPGFVTGSLITSAIYGARPVCYWFLHYLDSQQTGPIRTAVHEARLGQAWALATANRFCIKSHHVITAFSFIAEVPVFWVKGWEKEGLFLCTCFIDWPARSVWEPFEGSGRWLEPFNQASDLILDSFHPLPCVNVFHSLDFAFIQICT